MRNLCADSQSDQASRPMDLTPANNRMDAVMTAHLHSDNRPTRPEPTRGASTELSRRRFLRVGAAVGGGLLLSLSLPLARRDGAQATEAEPFVPNAFIRIEGDGRIVLTMPYVEMGQGTYTAIPMLIAEELEVDLNQVQVEHAPPNERLYANPLLGVQATGNSNAIRGAWQPLRKAGAVARTMLVSAAAQRWNVRVRPKPMSIARPAVAASSQSGLAFREGCVREPTERSIGTKQAAPQLDVNEPTRARVHRYTCDVKRYDQ